MTRNPHDQRRIEARAYQIWEDEGRPDGRDLDHWREAQQQLEVEFRVGFPDATGNEAALEQMTPRRG